VWAISALVILAVASPATAAPITVTEVTDFDNSAPGSIVGTLDVGVNTISGHWSALTADNDTGDYFSLVLPAGMRVTEVFAGVSNVSCCDGSGVLFFDSREWTTDGPGFDFSPLMLFFHQTLVLPAIPATQGTGPMTFFAGFSGYEILSGTVTGGGFDWLAHYTVVADPTVSTVPEPASLLLLAPGVGALMRRRKTKFVDRGRNR
jgi:hypothetical protein